MSLSEKDPLQKRLEITNWIILALLVGGSLFIASGHFSGGVLAGGLISVVNFHWLYRNLLNAFAIRPERLRSAVMIRYALRLALTAGALFWLIAGGHVDVIGLIIGLSVVPMNIILTTVHTLSRKNSIAEVR